jgi:hypothetical protein
LIVTLVLCLVVFAIICEAIISLILTSKDVSIMILFTLLFLAGAIFLLGLAWSALRHLLSKQPSLVANEQGLTLNHLPFLGNITLAWSEVQSVHVTRSLLFSYLCIVPQDMPQLIRRYGLLRFIFNSVARASRRTGAPLNISQNSLDLPVKELAERLEQKYDIKSTPATSRK